MGSVKCPEPAKVGDQRHRCFPYGVYRQVEYEYLVKGELSW